MNVANFINIYTNIYTYIICDENDQNKNDSINLILQHDRGNISYISISILDPVSQAVQMKVSCNLLSYKE